MEESKKINLTREELYERVWSLPMSKLCKEFGLSDKGLAKLCHRLEIPVPGSSFWRRMNLGQNPPRLPLLSKQEVFPITFPGPKSEPELPECPEITVPTKLKDPHELIIKTKQVLESKASVKQRSVHFEMKNVVAIYVTKGSVSRALRIMDTVIKAIEVRGGKVEIKEDRGTFINIKGQSIQIFLQELNRRIMLDPNRKKKPYEYSPDIDFAPTGNLMFKIEAGHNYLQNCFQDRNKTKLEDRVGEIIRNVELFAESRNQRDKEWAEEEAWRSKREKERKLENEKITRLFDEMTKWEETMRIKNYLSAIMHENNSENNPQNPEWIEWVKNYLIRRETRPLDPIGRF